MIHVDYVGALRKFRILDSDMTWWVMTVYMQELCVSLD